jgi:hypothetical protein
LTSSEVFVSFFEHTGTVGPVRHRADNRANDLLQSRAVGRIQQIIDDLDDCPSEAIAIALADAVFILGSSTEARISLCLEETDLILQRLHSNGFHVVRRDRSLKPPSY